MAEEDRVEDTQDTGIRARAGDRRRGEHHRLEENGSRVVLVERRTGSRRQAWRSSELGEESTGCAREEVAAK